jgi:hypothetical protein
MGSATALLLRLGGHHSLSTELYQVILNQALSRRHVERNVSVVPTLPAAPVVPALFALIGIVRLGNQENASLGEVLERRGCGARSPISEDIALWCLSIFIGILRGAGTDPARRIGTGIRVCARGSLKPRTAQRHSLAVCALATRRMLWI